MWTGEIEREERGARCGEEEGWWMGGRVKCFNFDYGWPCKNQQLVTRCLELSYKIRDAVARD